MPKTDPRRIKASSDSRRGIKAEELPPPIRPGHCDLCEQPAEHLKWDHDHTLEHLPKVEQHRGWLCHRCNLGLGLLGDDLRGIGRAFEYLLRIEVNRG